MSEIRRWLDSIGLGQYGGAFEANKIDMDLLEQVDDQILKDMGVSAAGDRLRIRNAIAKLITASVAELNLSPTTPKHETTTPSAERRQLTVMFCDLVGSTALSARLDPEDLRGIITAYHRCCTELVERNGGFVAKYMGDGVLTYFGYPKAHEHDAERAVRAGLALVEAVPKLATNVGSPLQVRIGMATGLVVVGDLIGAGAAQEQAVVGETPNLAARLQALAEPGTVVIASSTRLLTGGLFEYRDLGAFELKGFAGNVPAWQVLREGAAESRFEALRATTMPLVGRDEEIELLLRRWEQTKKGDGCVVLISGEPGIGKSRIAQTIVERLSGEAHTRLRYFCSPHHQDSALYPSIAQLERAAGFRREDTSKQRLTKLEAVLSQGTNDLGEAVPLLADLLSIPIGDRYPPLNLTPQKRKARTLHAQLTQVEGLASRQPVLIVFEDVHWSDPTTRESLDLLVDRVSTLRVLVIITFRPEFSPPWVGRPHVTIITLNRLAPRQRADMIKGVIGGKGLPKEITEQIIERTDGIPLFIEELTKAVIETGVVAEAGDHYKVTGPLTPLAIPTSLHASLLARLDRLAPVREVAQIAAALGRQFSHELIRAVAGMPDRQLDSALEQLANTELIFRRGIPPDCEYTFKHALVQDAAYGTLLRSRRQQIHGTIASTLEAKFPDIVTSQPALLAQHCCQAGLIDKGTGYWLKAGQQSVARSAMMEAMVQLEKGLDLLPNLPDGSSAQQRELDLRITMGRALLATKGYGSPASGENYARARALAEQLDRSDYLVPLLYGQGSFHNARGEWKLGEALFAQIEKIGERTNDAAVLVMGHYLHGIVHVYLGEFVMARALFEKCNNMSDPAHRALVAEDPQATSLAFLGLTLSYLGYIDQARARIRDALSEARQLGNPYTLTFVTYLACAIELLTNSPETAKCYALALVALSNEHGFSWFATIGTMFQGWSLTALGRPQQGLTLLTNGLSALRAAGTVLGTTRALILLAGTYSKLRQPLESMNCLAEAEQIIEMAQERYMEAELYCLRGDLTLSSCDPTAAEPNYQRALTVARQQKAKVFELRAATSLARLWRGQGKRTEARDLLSPVYGWFTEGFDTPVLQDAKALLDELA
jgi:class 3 adenylate cyclase/tetratricopeptide (TPR) repeat protein